MRTSLSGRQIFSCWFASSRMGLSYLTVHLPALVWLHALVVDAQSIPMYRITRFDAAMDFKFQQVNLNVGHSYIGS